jgi:hypothetical protein
MKAITILFFMFANFVSQASGATYYVSPTGSDTNAGTDPSVPWQTIAKVNGFTFALGDSVLFQGGQSFTGCLAFGWNTNVPNSAITSPFVLSSYGEGKALILSNCTGHNTAAVKIDAVNGFVMKNLAVSANGTQAQYGVLIQNTNTLGGPTTYSGITVQHSEISGFNIGAAPTYYGSSAEVEILGLNTAGHCGALDTINILDNSLHGENGPASYDDDGIYSVTCGALNNGPAGNISNVTYSGNQIYDLGGGPNFPNIANGIVANGVNGGLLQNNVAHDIGGNSTSCGGPGGVWAYFANNITIQFNEVYNMRPLSFTKGCDWVAYDVDGGVTNSVIQYNNSHDNFGSGLLAFVGTVGAQSWGPNEIHHNSSVNDGQIGLGNVQVTKTPNNSLKIYSNYLSSPSINKVLYCFVINSGTAWPAGSMIEYNTCNTGGDPGVHNWAGMYYAPYMPVPTGGVGLGMPVDYNNYYSPNNGVLLFHWGNGPLYQSLAAWQAATGEDTHSTSLNPLQ